jgi:hypothetical protein
MKTIASLFLVLSVVLSANAQSTFTSSLSPIVTTAQNSWFPASARFSLDGSSAGFVVSFGAEAIVPSSAQLLGSAGDFSFDLGSPHIAIHSPGPWRSGYNGATAFYGSFIMPDSLREDFFAGTATVQLLGSAVGDFRGALVPVPEPTCIALFAGGLTLLALVARKKPHR